MMNKRRNKNKFLGGIYMQSGISTLIIGAGIGLVASIITIIVTSIFHLIRDSKTRKWQIDDIKRNLETSILKTRVSDVEIFLNQASGCAKKLFVMEEKLLAVIKHNDLNLLYKDGIPNFNPDDFRFYTIILVLKRFEGKRSREQETTLEKQKIFLKIGLMNLLE